jgi:iron(III) transport system permease protein
VLEGYPTAVLLLHSLLPQAMEGRFTGFGDAYVRIFQTQGLPAMLWNSLRWGVATTVGAWIIGIPAGYLLARTDLRGKALARLTVLIPIMTPPYIAAISYILVMQPGGFADALLGSVPAPLRATFFGFWGVTFVMAIASFGYVTLGVEAALRALPNRLEDAASSLGATLLQRLRWVTVPLLLPAILNTGLLVFLDALSNFGVPAILGARANLPLLPAEIYFLVTSWPVDLPLATALSTLLLLAAVGAMLINQRLLKRFQSVSGRTGASHVRPLPPVGQVLAWAFFGGVFLLSVGIPYAAMILTSFVERWGEGLPSLTLAHYRELFTPGSRGLTALWTSLWLSVAAASACVILGGFTAYTIARNRGPVATALDGMTLLPRVLPKIVMAVALIMAWNAPWVRVQVYGTVWILLIAYISLYLSDALRYGDTGMRQIAARLEHAAEQLGAPRWRVFVSVTLPLLRPALFAAWITTFIVCMRDLVASVILLPPGVETTGSFIFNQFEQGDIAAAMAMATVTIGLSTGVLLLIRVGGGARG